MPAFNLLLGNVFKFREFHAKRWGEADRNRDHVLHPRMEVVVELGHNLASMKLGRGVTLQRRDKEVWIEFRHWSTRTNRRRFCGIFHGRHSRFDGGRWVEEDQPIFVTGRSLFTERLEHVGEELLFFRRGRFHGFRRAHFLELGEFLPFFFQGQRNTGVEGR